MVSVNILFLIVVLKVRFDGSYDELKIGVIFDCSSTLIIILYSDFVYQNLRFDALGQNSHFQSIG